MNIDWVVLLFFSSFATSLQNVANAYRAAGKLAESLEVYKALGLDKLDCSVAIIKNVKSNKMGKKDILKILMIY